jgi:imidazolonepropionase-like amidohydrolase
MDASRRIVRDGSVAVRDGRIVAIGAAGDLRPSPPPMMNSRTDATGKATLKTVTNRVTLL